MFIKETSYGQNCYKPRLKLQVKDPSSGLGQRSATSRRKNRKLTNTPTNTKPTMRCSMLTLKGKKYSGKI